MMEGSLIKDRTRRQFLKASAMGVCLPAFMGAGKSLLPAQALASDPWAQVPKILERIKPPIFPSRDFEISKYGAIGDGNFDCTAVFQQAISACNKAGGGTVLVPKGDFLTGAIHLKSNVRLHLSEGATIRFLRDPNKYPIVLTRFEGVEVMNFSPFIYAFEQENIAITGKGTLDGNADEEHWWSWKGRKSGSGPTQNDDRNRLFA
ncbi:MAG TPA: glycosyl hydrolase family 28-related protein, partial [Terriglobales bacterium]